MTLEEKRQLHIEISQLLADAGINRQTLKEMVKDEMNKKIDQAIDNYFNSKEFKDKIDVILNKYSTSRYLIDTIISKALQNKRVNIEIKNKED